MILHHLTLQNFRSYSKSEFDFHEKTTLIVGPNTAGKSNLIESIHLLSTGKSFRADKDAEMIKFGQQIARVSGETSDTQLEVVFTNGIMVSREAPLKKYLVNGVGKRRVDFEGILPSVLFSPVDLELIIGSPGNRRNFLDDVLEQTDRDYRLAINEYVKALRQRNALLEHAQETGVRSEKQFEYWDGILIKHGQLITHKRAAFLIFVNDSVKDVFKFEVVYDKSEVSKERLAQYKGAEMGSGVTLVGPHRDEFFLYMGDAKKKHHVKVFGSRGQQRLVVLQLKLLQITYIQQALGDRPILLLDDIFSELDQEHIELVMSMIGKQQTIITTTHKKLVTIDSSSSVSIIELV